MTDRVRIAHIGVTYPHGEGYIESLLLTPGVELVALYDSDPHTAKDHVPAELQDLEIYDGFARLLDTMQIEIGALGGGIKSVDYATNLSGAIKKRSVEGGKHEKRLFFAPTDKQSELWTRQLLGKASIQTQGRVILHFYSAKAENLLATVETQAFQKAGKRLDEVRRTYFSVRRSGGSFQFVVDKQEYRPRPQY